MKQREQIEILRKVKGLRSFAEMLKASGPFPLRAKGVEILQINVGKRCLMQCRHCHVEAGPLRTEVMGAETFEMCLAAAKGADIPVIDITGGSPEMNPHLESFIERAVQPGRRLMVRSNLAVLLEKEYAHHMDVYADHGVEIVGSLPDCDAARTDRQRGSEYFRKAIAAMRALNERGYAQDGSGLVLDLVHNPLGAYLPGAQRSLEIEYKKKLLGTHDVAFNSLFCLANCPVGRYLEFLVQTGNLEDYLRNLERAFNPRAAGGVMCRYTVSVGWDGILFDCDFNQMLELAIAERLRLQPDAGAGHS
jgi:radical SAM/Cys-rich protein